MSAAPSELRLHKDRRTLTVRFDDVAYALPAEFLRVESPSAEVKGHGGPKVLVPGKKDVTITGLEPVGHYAVQLTFSDGHRTGIYSWDYLAELGREQPRLWGTYLRNLAEHGLSRDSATPQAFGCGGGCGSGGGGCG